MRWALIVGGLLIATLTAAPALAQPTVIVRAESRLELDVRRDVDGLVVTGALRDDLGVALAGNDVTLELSHAVASEHRRTSRVITRVVTATADGTFSTHFQVDAGDYVVDAGYEGAAEHTGTHVTRFFDLDRAHVSLRVALDDGTRIDLSVAEHRLTIVATSETGGQDLAMSVTDESGDAELGHGTTDADGVLHVSLESARLGPPAAGRLVVRTVGDATRAEAQSELPVVRFRPTETTIALSRAIFSPGDTLGVTGTLTDGVGPLPREAISVVSADRVLSTVLTDERGRYDATLDESAFTELEGEVPIVARFDGAAPWIPGSESRVQRLTLSRPLALGWLWAIVPIALAALAVRWSLRRERGAAPIVRRPDGAPGVALGARRLLAAQRFDVSGIVRDAISGDPVVGATVRAGEHEATTDAMGAFAFTATREASSLVVDHVEYLPLETIVALPHRGEHDAMHFRMASRRAVSFAALRQVAAGLASDGEVALALTQREIFEVLRSRGASPPTLPDLVSRVEVACYAEGPPNDAEIAEIRRSAGAILARPIVRAASAGAARGRR